MYVAGIIMTTKRKAPISETCRGKSLFFRIRFIVPEYFLSCLFQCLYFTVLSISAYSLDVIDMLFLTLRGIICQFGIGKYLQRWNVFRLRHFKTNSTQFEDPIYFSWLSLEAFALKANNCLHIRMAYSFYKNTYS